MIAQTLFSSRWTAAPCRARAGFGTSPFKALFIATSLAVFASFGCSPSPDEGTPDASADAGASGDVASDGSTPLVPGQLGLVSLTPDRGPVEGGTTVDLLGQEFTDTTQVFFGDEEATVDWLSGTTHLYVTVPAQQVPGRFDVRVVDKDGAKAVLANAFTYLAEVKILDVEPALGPHIGGTVIEIHGDGFLPGDRALVGYRECLQTQVIDSNTIMAVTPPADMADHQHRMSVLVSVRHASGIATLAKVFTYGRPPRVDYVAPAIVALAGEGATLHGRALGNAKRLFADDILAQLSPGTASSSRGTQLPAAVQVNAKAGDPVALLIDSPFGATVRDPAYAYASGVAKLHGVTPSEGTTEGGEQVAVIVELAGETVESVQFGGDQAVHVEKNGVLLVTTPKHAKGPVDVTVKTSGGTLTASSAFTYHSPIKLTLVTPTVGPIAGGNQLQLTGSGFSQGCTVKVGAFAAKVSELGATGILAIAPPGPAGSVDVTVTCGSATSKLVNGYGYTTGKPRINAVAPAQGATGGGTAVTIYGSGFVDSMQVYFGGKQATEVTTLDSGRLRAKTPSNDPGPVNVSVVHGALSDTVIDGFLYFSPTQPHGGTYGSPAIGTLNVTVLNIYTLKPIVKAWVQLGQPGTSQFDKYGAWSDEEGQAVFSGPDIGGELTVSAAKIEHSASSIIHFGVGNATLLLFPFVPPSPGGGNPPPGLPAARIKGKVLDLDKYVWVSPNNCLKETLDSPQCEFCELPTDCTPVTGETKEWQCILTGAAGKRCFHGCQTDSDCGKSFACVPDIFDPENKVCKPSLGIRQIRCTTSCRGLACKEPETDADPPVAIVDEDTGEYTLDPVRLDELAVVCRAGYVVSTADSKNGVKSGDFVPNTMGVKRHIFPQPAETIEGVNIRLNIPLRRTLHTRLANPPKFFPSKNAPGRMALSGWLHLGSDGFIPLAEVERNPLGKESGVRDNETLFRQPLTLPAELTATTYVYRAVARFGPESPTAPQSGTHHDDIVSAGDTNIRVRSKHGEWTDTSIGLNTTIAAALEGGPDDVLLVMEDGRLYRGTLTDPFVVWFPPQLDPYSSPAQVHAAAGTAGDATIVGQAGLIRRWKDDVVEQEKGVLSEDLVGVCVHGNHRVVAGEKGGLAVNVGGAWVKVAQADVAPLRDVTCTPTGALAVGDEGRVVEVDVTGDKPTAVTTILSGKPNLFAITQTAAGQSSTVWVAGDGQAGVGPTLMTRVAGAWTTAWPAGFNPKDVPNLRRLVPLSGGTVLVTDALGGVWRISPAGVGDESPLRRDLRVFSGLRLKSGQALLVGEPGLWLGPFLTIPEISKPEFANNPKEMQVEWAVQPGPLPSINRVHLDGQGFPFWWLYLAPGTTSVTLPDFESLKNIPIFLAQVTSWLARVDRIYIPDLTIDGFSTFDVEFDTPRSWSTNYRQFQP